MRELNIAYGNNRQAKRWVNKTIRFDDLKERLKVTIRTTESVEEYAKMSRAQRDAAKDHGGFVAGGVDGGEGSGGSGGGGVGPPPRPRTWPPTGRKTAPSPPANRS